MTPQSNRDVYLFIHVLQNLNELTNSFLILRKVSNWFMSCFEIFGKKVQRGPPPLDYARL